MAKTTRKRSRTPSKPKAEAKVEDAVVVEETDTSDVEVEAAQDAKSTEEKMMAPDTDDVETTDPAEDTVGVISTEPDTEEVSSTEAGQEEPKQPEVEVKALVPVASEVTVQKVGFLPLVGGGIVAGGLGFLSAWYGLDRGDNELGAEVLTQAEQIDALSAQIEALPDPVEAPEIPDLAPISASIDDLRSESGEQIAELQSVIDSFEERLTAVERAPSGDGGLTDTAIASFEREIAGLREEISSQESRIQEMADGAAADLQEAQEQLAAAAAAAEAEALAAQEEAQAAISAAALAELRIAMDTGEPFDAAVSDLEATGVTVPESLAALASDGMVTEEELQAEFPDLARNALSLARSEGLADQDSGGLTSFFRSQFDVRSVEPREGDDPDAVLSRAEASLRSGDLESTLAEVATLPDPLRDTFSDWLARSEARAAAIAAISELDVSLNN